MKKSNGEFDLSGKTAVIMGGAGYLGKEFATALATSGACVYLADRDGASLDRAAGEAGAPVLDIRTAVADAVDRDALAALRDRIRSERNRVDILINSVVGVGRKNHFGSFESYAWEDWEEVIRVNLGGPFLAIQTLCPLMEGGASVINIGSIYGVVSADPGIYGDSGWNSPCSYAASKGGLIQLTRYLAVHLAPKKIRVNAISPGGVYRNHEEGFVRSYSARVPMGRMLQKEELRGTILYLASEASAYVTGQNLLVDGGWTAW